jgi:hypothetical protein
MSDEFLGDRKKALEESFFARENEKLRRELIKKETMRAKREVLAEVSGVSDAAVLDHLITLDIGSDTLAALSLVPLVEVAWADGNVDDDERGAILNAAESMGLGQQGEAGKLLDSWLAEQPGSEMLTAWKEYVAALCETLDVDEKARLKQDLLGRARSVAEAAGGFLGLGNKVSKSEQAKLDELDKAFG